MSLSYCRSLQSSQYNHIIGAKFLNKCYVRNDRELLGEILHETRMVDLLMIAPTAN